MAGPGYSNAEISYCWKIKYTETHDDYSESSSRAGNSRVTLREKEKCERILAEVFGGRSYNQYTYEPYASMPGYTGSVVNELQKTRARFHHSFRYSVLSGFAIIELEESKSL